MASEFLNLQETTRVTETFYIRNSNEWELLLHLLSTSIIVFFFLILDIEIGM